VKICLLNLIMYGFNEMADDLTMKAKLEMIVRIIGSGRVELAKHLIEEMIENIDQSVTQFEIENAPE
jgi:hypothetical protein